jgi:hypothetical protein
MRYWKWKIIPINDKVEKEVTCRKHRIIMKPYRIIQIETINERGY